MSVAPLRLTGNFQFDNVSNMHCLPGRSIWDENVNVPQKKQQSTVKTFWKPILVIILIVLMICGTIIGTIVASLTAGQQEFFCLFHV